MQAHWSGGRPEGGDRAALSRPHLGARLRDRRSSPRSGADRQLDARRARRRRAGTQAHRRRRGGEAQSSRAPACRSSTSTCCSNSTCTMSGRPIRSRRRCLSSSTAAARRHGGEGAGGVRDELRGAIQPQARRRSDQDRVAARPRPSADVRASISQGLRRRQAHRSRARGAERAGLVRRRSARDRDLVAARSAGWRRLSKGRRFSNSPMRRSSSIPVCARASMRSAM